MKRLASVGSLFLMCALLVAGLACSSGGAPSEQAVGGAAAGATPSTDYNDLLALFDDWRQFARPRWVDGVPDYSESTMARQYDELLMHQRRLEGFDIEDWSISQQIDYPLVRAELNGIEFTYRVMRPWTRWSCCGC